MTNEKAMSPEEVIHWLEICGDKHAHRCKECPYYGPKSYDSECDKLLLDAAELLLAAYGLDGGAVDGQAEAAE